MKIEKNKIVFGSVLAIILLFLFAYTMWVFGGDDEPAEIKQTLVPELEQEQRDFKSRYDAVNALKEVRETTAPSIYDERFLDSLGYYDPDLRNKQKTRMVDSIITNRYRYGENIYSFNDAEEVLPENSPETIIEKVIEKPAAKELGLEHQLFYSSNPQKMDSNFMATPLEEMIVEVDGNHVVQAGYRLRMRLTEDAVINGMAFSKNTPVFGFISFQVNRAMIEIKNIEHQPVKLKAYDLQDGSEGIYVENSIRSDATREVLDDIIQDINVAGLPQVGGIKKVFQRNNRNVKVTVTNNYKLILKSAQ